ncbi:fosfomycin resistance glutathione transferase [Bowmanella sp. Y26]|uniref:fosfomycin resistance glutathione transferase n=1 Tax=Bowmanella yangjiangensis TaxID=2811230 RepID=UPI001BDC4912|nr:fosfomycin resistance glutathione transferase [Bowmanella yangjiangensis]MBT1064128.1 fosfomycin resistance glutathione transferase [Bowmanella yangjiangensis]
MLKGLNHITLAVADVQRSVDFYTLLLGFKGHARWQRGAYLSLGELWLCLSLDKPEPAQDYTHLAFSLDKADFEPFCQRLQQAGTSLWKDNSSEGESLYFLDPDGHKLEAHVGDLTSRLHSLRQHPYDGLQWL